MWEARLINGLGICEDLRDIRLKHYDIAALRKTAGILSAYAIA